MGASEDFEAFQPIIDKLDMKKFYSLRQIPKSYLNCTEDISLPQGDKMPDFEPAWLSLLEVCLRVGGIRVGLSNAELAQV